VVVADRLDAPFTAKTAVVVSRETRPWDRIVELRAELWATRQELTRVRTNRNHLARQLREASPLTEREMFELGYRMGGGTDITPFVAGTCGGIIGGESGWDATAINAKNSNGSVDRGPLQINSVHAADFLRVTGHPWETGAHNWVLSGRMAAFIQFDLGQGLNAWVAYWKPRKGAPNGCGK